ncbi:MAG: Na+:solute symporter, partial [Actinopolymorphaceae bacterium]
MGEGAHPHAIFAVVTRDILPAVWRGIRGMAERTELVVGRISVFTFIALSMVIALTADSFGGVLGLIILWFGGLVGPIAIPMLFGLLPAFRRCGPSAAILSWAAGLVTFVVTRYVIDAWVASLAPDLVTAVQ